jgi:Zn-dependent protease
MPRFVQGSIHLSRIAGIDLFLHWSWFVVAIFEIGSRSGQYSSLVWNVLEYLALFGIVLMHEFGHALACRQVGGTADRIMLWPLGGVAYVNPPLRPGATLWSIAAGPLVNVALVPVLLAAIVFSHTSGLASASPDFYRLLQSVQYINAGLLIFNILPIYPLDGGQILWSLLWFFMGRGRSLVVASVLGIIGGIGFIALAAFQGSTWLLLIAAYMLMSCWGGLKNARTIIRNEKRPRRAGVACPNCHAAPPMGPIWRCNECGEIFDTFETRAVCPSCGAQHPITMCIDCRQVAPIGDWFVNSHTGTVIDDHATVINGQR